jgi:WD40-like Beta Propeller Repeat
MIWGIPKSKGGIVIRKAYRLMLYVLFLIAILAGCTKTTEIVPPPLPPTDTQVPTIKTPQKPTASQVPATKSIPPPTDTPVMPTQTLEALPTTSSINETPMIERVSVASDGTQENADAIGPSISADGRYVAFSSEADNLVKGDTNGVADIFVHDRKTGETQRVSVASDGTQGNNGAGPGASVSADGRYVAFNSSADNLVKGDTNGVQDVFVHDRVTGETTRVSVASDGTQANNVNTPSPCMCIFSGLSISADGRYVVFNSNATNLVEGDTNRDSDIFVHDLVTGETTRVSVASDGTQGNRGSYGSSISADGRYVAFDSFSSNLLVQDNNEIDNVFVHDRVSGETARVSISSDGMKGNSLSIWPSISADGHYVAFRSFASNLVEGDTNGVWDGFVHDRVTGETTRVSVASDGIQTNSDSDNAVISADGRYVTFTSSASNLVVGDTNGVSDIFVHDMKTGQTQIVSIASDGLQGNGYSYWSSITVDGRYLAFASNATNLVGGDTNGHNDIFVTDLLAIK